MATATRTPLQAARDLGPALRDRSEEIEALRRLPDDVVAALRDAGMLRLWVPASLGGPEAHPLDLVAAVRELARHDTGAAWCAFIASSTSLCAGLLPRHHAEDLFGHPGAVAGGFAAPVGRARPVEGGLSVTGRWQWGSGTQHCTVVGGGTLLVDDRGEVAPRADGLLAPFVFLDPDDVTFLDTWDSLGVRGSGSTDYEASGAFVPEGRWVELTRPVPVEDGPLYRLSFFGLLGSGIAATALGVLDRAIEELVDLAVVKVPQGSGKPLAARPATQLDLARAEATARSAAAFLDDALGSAFDVADAGDPVDVEHRRLIRLAVTDATQRACDAVVRLHRVAGGEAVYRRSPLERLLRDASTVSQHAMAAERTYELAGRLALGLDTDTATL